MGKLDAEHILQIWLYGLQHLRRFGTGIGSDQLEPSCSVVLLGGGLERPGIKPDGDLVETTHLLDQAAYD
jgi:hypothetical protein